jgi:hypothetical protein
MRFAVSAAAAASGLALFALAFLGDPAAWLGQARRGPLPHVVALAPPDGDVEAAKARAAALQGEVDRLRYQLASRPAAPVVPPPAPADVPPVPVAVPERHEAASAAAPEHREARRTAVPPRPARPAPGDDHLRSVLARLRQSAGPPPVGLGEPEPAADAPPPPALGRLAAARAALAGGRTEDARRLLQDAQVMLVFRPIAPEGDAAGAPGAAAGAGDVARALAALGGNDPGLCLRYVDRAVGDLEGAAPQPIARPPVPGPSGPSGYAPAYPPR